MTRSSSVFVEEVSIITKSIVEVLELNKDMYRRLDKKIVEDIAEQIDVRARWRTRRLAAVKCDVKAGEDSNVTEGVEETILVSMERKNGTCYVLLFE